MDVRIRPMEERDLPEADRVMRLAFGTFLNLADPMQFAGSVQFVRPRWLTSPESAFTAEAAGRLVGSNFATVWGAHGFFGPLTVHPDLWGQGVASLLMDAVMEHFEAHPSLRHVGLYTFAHSPKHLALYQRYGFWPGHLTALGQRAVDPRRVVEEASRLSQMAEPAKEATIAVCRALAEELLEGLDPTREIRGVLEHRLGDVVLVPGGFAICHLGPGTEGGHACYLKLGVAGSAESFRHLLEAVDGLAAESGLGVVTAGVNTARLEAYRTWLEFGFRPYAYGVAMHRPAGPAHNRPGIFAVDDWR